MSAVAAERNGAVVVAGSVLAADGPLAGYRAEGVEDDRLSGLVAGVTGALVVLVLFGGLTLVLRRRRESDAAHQDAAHQDGAHQDGADV